MVLKIKSLQLAHYNRPSDREESAVRHYQTSLQEYNKYVHLCFDHLTFGEASAVQYPLSVKSLFQI